MLKYGLLAKGIEMMCFKPALEANLYIAAFVFSLHKAEPNKITPEIVDNFIAQKRLPKAMTAVIST